MYSVGVAASVNVPQGTLGVSNKAATSSTRPNTSDLAQGSFDESIDLDEDSPTEIDSQKDAVPSRESAPGDIDMMELDNAAAVKKPASNPEMVPASQYSKSTKQSAALQENPLDEAETEATMAVVLGSNTTVGESDPSTEKEDLEAILDQLRPYAKGDMELSVGIGAFGGDGGMNISAGAVFAYYVINRFGPGLELNYQASFGDFARPQSLTVFPFLKYVLIRSARFAPYILVGSGRMFQWGGGDGKFDTVTGDFGGYAPVSAWLFGIGGGVCIGIGGRMSIQIQLLAMYNRFDEQMWRNVQIEVSYATDTSGNVVPIYELGGDRTDRFWYPAPSFWLSFAL